MGETKGDIELEMPSKEEGEKPELRMVIVPLVLAKLLWWTLDDTEKRTGISTTDSLSVLLKQSLMKEFLYALLERMKGEI